MEIQAVSCDDWPEPPKIIKRRAAIRKWSLRKRAEGIWCHNCFKRKAGSDNGSKVLCGPCRRARRKTEEQRRRRKQIPTREEFLDSQRRCRKRREPKPEELAFKKKPAMHEGRERVEKMFALAKHMDALKRLGA